MNLSEHFTLHEITFSDKAVIHGIDNTPSTLVIHNLRKTAERMEQVRKLLGDRPIKITSGYRSEELNRKIGGSTTSAHCKGLAVDFVCPSFGTPRDIAIFLSSFVKQLDVDQLIFEGGWVHLGWVSKEDKPRHEIRTAVFEEGKKTRYPEGII